MTGPSGLPGLVIFDCDGVLVDSEPISLSVTLETLAQIGCPLTEQEGYERLLGRSIGTISKVLAQDYGIALTAAHLDQLRTRLFDRFRNELRPIDGVGAAVKGLGCPVCVASSSAPDRIAFSLTQTGLWDLFAPHVFSATMVQRGKPAPDLFLYAAKQMGVAPEDCVVVEDSPAGIKSAQAAGMRVIAFFGGGHAGPAGLLAQAAELNPDGIVANMCELDATLRTLC